MTKFKTLYDNEKNRRIMLENFRLPEFDKAIFSDLQKSHQENEEKMIFLEKENLRLKAENQTLQ